MGLLVQASWHSIYLEVVYLALGWFAFAVWSTSFYPQVILNYRRKSVVGLNFDFLVFNLTKHSSYLIYNAALYFSPAVQRQYREKYGQTELIPVAPSDVAFSIHAVLLTAFTIYQVFIYERGTQRVSKTCVGITIAAWGAAVISLIIAIPTAAWLWLVSVFNIIQVVMTAIKYFPQAWMNFKRKSTVGWSIGNILLDLSGGVANLLQMVVQSIDQKSTANFSGNLGKLGLSLEVIVFDVFFIIQHYGLYPDRLSAVEESQPFLQGDMEDQQKVISADHKD
ncbi:hypothetical protein O6H91_16G072500 [Diphasiastrum complanatum]|uniref:Uncharacterized protein n=1 Tax=Diphasiastrum complanatum TaxID=34168 RepID=A0ACC2BED2_DIPCM|nr:hypothetical protein O6H91_16G072500 [Diphasiastrum complanatum]